MKYNSYFWVFGSQFVDRTTTRERSGRFFPICHFADCLCHSISPDTGMKQWDENVSKGAFLFLCFLLKSLFWKISKVASKIHQSTKHITLGCLDDGTTESSTKSLMFFQVFFFLILFRDLGKLKTLYFYFCNFIKKDFCKKICKKSWRKNNTWNIRCLVYNSFVPSSKQPSVCKLTDFKCTWKKSGLTWSFQKKTNPQQRKEDKK